MKLMKGHEALSFEDLHGSSWLFMVELPGCHIDLLHGCSYLDPAGMGKRAKVTVELPADLLARARRSTKLGITATIRRGLELIASARAAEDLRSLRGKVNFSIDLGRLRKDRR